MPDRSTARIGAYTLAGNVGACCLRWDGREALKALKKCAFEVVLMDVQMPEIDGFETTRAVREGEILTKEYIPNHRFDSSWHDRR
jgi:CheY-like chemotaxis protein